MLGAGNYKLLKLETAGAGNWRLAAGNWKLEAGNW
jgi:hypothetical protein